MNKIASLLAVTIGLMAVVAGGLGMMGTVPNYYIIDWLPVYNFVLGIFTALVASVVLWKGSRLALAVAAGILGAHLAVIFILQTVYQPVVALESLVAMGFRVLVWVIIFALLIAQRKMRPVNHGAL